MLCSGDPLVGAEISRWCVQLISLFFWQHDQRKQACLRDCEDGQPAGLRAQHRLPVGLHGPAFRGVLQVSDGV